MVQTDSETIGHTVYVGEIYRYLIDSVAPSATPLGVENVSVRETAVAECNHIGLTHRPRFTCELDSIIEHFALTRINRCAGIVVDKLSWQFFIPSKGGQTGRVMLYSAEQNKL